MTARIAGFVTRADAGLRGPRSVSKNITPEKGGVAPHYGGPRQPAAEPGSEHARCVSTWRNWQKYHMDTHGWVDIAYTGGFCNHGYAFAGRGVGIRTAANGTNTGNQNFYAVTWIGGEGQTPTQEALDAADWWIHTLRSKGANTQVKPHRFFKATGCPGDPLVEYADSRNGQHINVGAAPAPSPTPTPTPTPPPARPARPNCKALQRAVRVDADNLWGGDTDRACDALRMASGYHGGRHIYGVRFTQKVVGTKQDGSWGPLSVRAHRATVSAVQQALHGMGFDPTGYGGQWGPHTERAYQAARNATHI